MARRCPRISPDFLAKERRRLGDLLYSQEYECRFVTSGAGYFSGADLEKLFGDLREPDEPLFGEDVPRDDYDALFRSSA